MSAVQSDPGGQFGGGDHHGTAFRGLRSELIHRETGCCRKEGCRQETAMTDDPGPETIQGGLPA